jgi:AcrR family transcriptional regulator
MSSLRKKISEAAQELYLEEGIEGVSMRKIAGRVGVSAPAIYRHFRNKDELLDEIVTEGARILQEYLKPALEAETPYARLVNLTENYMRFALEQPKYFDFAFLAPNPSLERLGDDIGKPEWGTFRLAMEQVAACMEQGVFRRDEPMTTAMTIWAAAHGLVSLYRTGRLTVDEPIFRQLFRQAIDRVLRGLMSSP